MASFPNYTYLGGLCHEFEFERIFEGFSTFDTFIPPYITLYNPLTTAIVSLAGKE